MPIISSLTASPESIQRRFDQVARVAVTYWLVKYVFIDGFRHVRARGISGTIKELKKSVQSVVVSIMLKMPKHRQHLESELSRTRKEISNKLAPETYPEGIDLTRVKELPEHGRDKEWLVREFSNMKKLEKGDVNEGRVSGAVYHGGDDLNEIIVNAMSQFIVSNPLHPDVFPGVRKMEGEIVSMVLNLYNGSKGAGTTTSGGTESILMSCKAHRDWARDIKGISRPEMIIPSSAHAAFWKACEYFKIKLHVIPVNKETRKADLKAMKRAINPNTIMIVGSAVNFPDGTMDPIPELAKLAQRYKIGLHVDCCLGSFIIPFLHKAGFGEGVPVFDFRLPGVTAISCDIHKYAFCPKGTSVIMYHSSELRKYQYHVLPDWEGGVYASPSMAGSRPGAVLAGAWAVLNHVGADGYLESCKQIVSAARQFATILRTQFADDFYIIGDPKASVVAFNSKNVNIYAVGDAMSKKGWHLSALGGGGGLHMAFTRLSAQTVDQLAKDLHEVLEKVRKVSSGEKEGDMVALYGLGQTPAGPHVVPKLAEMFLDTLYA
nr:sphinganine-1-phosphate aldolase [Cryptococcus depauperatus CBS 7841]